MAWLDSRYCNTTTSRWCSVGLKLITLDSVHNNHGSGKSQVRAEARLAWTVVGGALDFSLWCQEGRLVALAPMTLYKIPQAVWWSGMQCIDALRAGTVNAA
jgi:hypothetical protein